MAKKIKKISARKRKKSWYDIISPDYLGSQVIGVTPAYEDADLGKRVVKRMLNEITGNMKQQNVKVILGVSNVKGNKINTDVIGFEINPSYVKRAVRKEKSKGEFSQDFQTNDANVRIKGTFVTRNKTSKAIRDSIVKTITNELQTKLSKMSYQDLVSELLSHRLQYQLKKKSDKIYPLSFCEIRYFRKVKDAKTNN